ncbi:SHOCT domain-containing protein [Nostocoides sp. F2B08]|uniref:SHOCT domain-containing protein n=1 Tax=Nostocoides sp. F2B08 TaxID=2653936 RepID=UPI001262C122|nr:SHOCT domain-containing protein [Tetrasphaera sp. F2B08]KAB7743035.1 SHOCT domain-containing protein [Tetrasphaera sp. F2B08]
MPGLIRGVARTAVVAGTASAVHGRVQRRQAEKFADRDAAAAAQRNAAYEQEVVYQAPPPPPPPPSQASGAAATDVVSQLKALAELRDQGILTEQEFAAQKSKILGG